MGKSELTRKEKIMDEDLWLDEFESVGGKVLPDKTAWLYHATTKDIAKQIMKEGILRTPPDAPASYRVYFSSSKAVAQDYGDGTLIATRVRIKDLHPDDVFPGRRMDFQVVGKIYKPIEMKLVDESMPEKTNPICPCHLSDSDIDRLANALAIKIKEKT